ncbi:sugar ABC transporter substrate-binding protein [Devosia rhodophyticola]|uniref:Sugar ABC transporter substrate-binding protein n=1 Tax=Devosia rhodophyticola TaxID=3026423 RepID=A0ABY7YYK7_9HYPH|nr:sugar ABC transporter substrate-binding protein [Devosia rhodophyticola]WDR06163.1 sugar ABC transporter substrate-binding protein [Devosia rhodophyticola]
MSKKLIKAMAVAAIAMIPVQSFAQTKIEWLQWFAAEAGADTYNSLVSEFEAANPDIKIELVNQPFGKVRESIVTDHAIGISADVLGLNMPWTKEFLDIGILAPLDDYLGKADNGFSKDQLVQAPIGEIDGHTWMVPLTAFPFVLHTNMTLVKEAGFEHPPTNWDELKEYATAISKLGDGISGIGLPFSSQPPANGPILTLLPLLYAHGGHSMNGTTPDFDNPAVVETLQLLNDLNASGAAAPGAASRTGGVDVEEFVAGRTGFLISPAAHSANVRERGADFEYAMTRVPGDVNAYRVHGFELGISANSKHKDEAWKFISFLLGKQANAKVAHASASLPGNLEALADFNTDGDEVLAKQMDILSNDTPVEELRQAPKATASWSIMTEEIQAMLAGNQTPEATAAAVQARWLELIK